MPLEIEAKMRLADPAGLRRRLRLARARRIGRVLEDNRFFDTPGGALRKSDCGLRLRGKTLTYKGPRKKGKLKTREEIELIIDDPAAMTELLDRLGFGLSLRFAKRRESWKLGRCRVEIDWLRELGWFVEIEGPDEKTVLAARQKLGLAGEPLIAEGYATLLRRAALKTPSV